MKYLLLGGIFFANIISAMPRRYNLTPEETKYRQSLRRYDSSKDVKLNEDRPSTRLPKLTQRNLKKHSASFPKYKKGFSIPQNPNIIPSIDMEKLNQLPRSRKINYEGHD